MNASRRYLVNALATGVIATILLGTGLFWARWLCSFNRHLLLPPSAREVVIRPSRRVAGEEGTDPNLLAPSLVTAAMGETQRVFCGLGASQYLGSHAFPGASDAWLWLVRLREAHPDKEPLDFDSSLGLFVYEGLDRYLQESDSKPAYRRFLHYAGPNGAGEEPDEKLGRFSSPIADPYAGSSVFVYDRGQRRFFAIEWDAKGSSVRKGPELADADNHHPVQIGAIEKNFGAIHMAVPCPTNVESPVLTQYFGGDRTLVLDASGRIDLLDMQTLQIIGVTGRLPTPMSPLGVARPVTPDDVVAYFALPYGVCNARQGREWTYRGCAVATLSREMLAVEVACFDPNGRVIESGGTMFHEYGKSASGRVGESLRSSAQAAYYHLPGARSLTSAKLILESLHPPVLVLASYFAGSHQEATAGFRSVLLLPDSFVAMVARAGGDMMWWERFGRVFCYMMPGVFFFGFLAERVARNAARIGLTRRTRKIWVVGTVVFGLPAYVAYRLTRPKGALVTCANCGLGRQPDMEKCHHCGSAWVVPELMPPSWRVLGDPEQVEAASPSPAEETSQPTKSGA
ncbi:MAG: hypothetical protein KBE65_06555 [Phycisphaerae bacterium]|nr:hypothetical protein [Phycisphaerae bacterium]